jgi:2-oxoglutarate ferredoxin oxidoreductase subunit beta
MSIKKMLQKDGFCFIEVISPCPEVFGRRNKLRTGLDMMELFKKNSVVENFSDPAKAEITPDRIVVGEFVDIQKLSYEKLFHEKIAQINEKAVEQVS